MWLDREDSQTELYVGPPVRTRGSDPLGVPSLVPADAMRSSFAHLERAVPRQRHERPLVTPITIGLAALCVIAGVSIGRWISRAPAHDHASVSTSTSAMTVTASAAATTPAAPTPAPTTPAATTPSVARAIAMPAQSAKPSAKPIVKPIVEPIVTATPIVEAPPPAPAALPPTTLRIETTPAGATVAFVGTDGATTIVGTSPVDATIDPAHAYDVLVTLADHVSRVEHVAPTGNHHLAIALASAR
ncbi:MAG TPA: hypothetical protein VGL61_30355 [Kofleriaceae bacterium]